MSAVNIDQTVLRPFVGRFDSFLSHVVAIPAAILVLAEIVVLFAGVIARFVLHTP